MTNEKSELLILAEDSFELAHELVALHQKLDLVKKGIFRIFKKIDYTDINSKAFAIRLEIRDLEIKISNKIKNYGETEFVFNLTRYSKVLYQAATLFNNKTDLLLQKSKNAKSVPWDQFNRVSKDEWAILGECQIIGDRLTELYNSLKD